MFLAIAAHPHFIAFTPSKSEAEIRVANAAWCMVALIGIRSNANLVKAVEMKYR
jgi:hypothetical protein